jgi:very-short-patch-repair endonuclease
MSRSRKAGDVKKNQNRVAQFISECAQHYAVRFEEECYHAIEKCESPIESLLLTALILESKDQPFTTVHIEMGDFPERPDFDEAAFVFPQVRIGSYRVDFAIWDASLPFSIAAPRVMVVECDGHDFHERTKEQARRDKQRDRYLTSHGYKVLRFTGSEIWADPGACAQEIISELAIDDEWRNRKK